MSVLPRLFVAPERLGAETPLRLRGAEHHYLSHVLRLGIGEKVLLLDGAERVATTRIVRASALELELEFLAIETAPRREGQTPCVTLQIGLLKGDRHDLVVQKATELGASRIVTVLCQRSIPMRLEERSARRNQRWQRIAQAAAQQCRRPDLPEVTPPRQLGEVLQAAPTGLRLMLYEGAAPPLRSVLAAHQAIELLVGPEGGLDPQEVDAATAAGFIPCSLGPRILRAETAALAALAVVLTP
jgi:16S rRNA (uracil1498-N3)-methyltransferase